MTSFSGAILVSVNFALIVLFWRITVRRFADIVSMYWLGIFGTLVLRPALLVLGLDDPFPSTILSELDIETWAVEAQLLVTLWIFGSGLGIVFLDSTRLKPWYESRDQLSAKQLQTACLGLTALAAATTLPVWVRFGGPSGLAEAFKIDKEVDFQALRTVPLTAAIFATAYFAETLRHQSSRLSKKLILPLVLFVVPAYLSFSWGARDAPVFGGLIILLSLLIFGPGRSKLPWLRLSMRFGVVVGAAFVLRIARDLTIRGEVNSAITENNPVGQISVATNLTAYDAMALVVRDGPPNGEISWGADFVRSLDNVVPVDIASQLDESRTIPLQVAQRYLPSRQNGWPITPVGDWLVNFGLPGVVLGALLTGILIGYLAKKLSKFEANPILFSLYLFAIFTWLRGGIWVQSISSSVFFTGPMLLSLYVAHKIPSRRRSHANGPVVKPLHKSAVHAYQEKEDENTPVSQ